MKISIIQLVAFAITLATIQQIGALPVTGTVKSPAKTKTSLDNNAVVSTTSAIGNTETKAPEATKTPKETKAPATNTPLVGTTSKTTLASATASATTSASQPTQTSNPADDQLIANSMFTVAYTCNFADKKVCDGVERSIKKAGGILTKSLQLAAKVNVKAAFGNQGGTAGTAEDLIELVDDDGAKRLYPSSLVKQFNCAKAPKFSGVDIALSINSGDGFHLEGDATPIKQNQQDIGVIALRELVHGLGSRTSWKTQTQFAKTTPAVLTPKLLSAKVGKKFQFLGFEDNAYDKNIFADSKSLRDSVKQLNSFSGGPGATFANEQEFVAKFIASDQGKLAQDVAKTLTTPKSTTFLDKGIVLDTTSATFKSGVSVDFFDKGTYEKSSDFLMTDTSGATLDQLVATGGGDGPIGPELLKLLSTMGYPTSNGGNSFKVCPGDFKLAGPITATTSATNTATTSAPNAAPATSTTDNTKQTPTNNPGNTKKPDATSTDDNVDTTPSPTSASPTDDSQTPTGGNGKFTSSTVVRLVTKVVPVVTTQTITNGNDVEALTSTIGSTESTQSVTEVKVVPLKDPNPTETDGFPDSASSISLNHGLMIVFTIISLVMGTIF